MPKSNGLTPKQKRFVQEYLKDLNAVAAAIRAGYSERSAHAIGGENLKKPIIRAAIDAALEKRAQRVEVTQDAVVEELARIGFASISDVAEWDDNTVTVHPSATRPRSVLAAVAGVVSTPHGLTVRMHDKTSALVHLGKHLGMFRERLDVDVRDGADVVEKLFDRLDEYADRE